jgi:5-methylcytosine-specific restriction enzyme A
MWFEATLVTITVVSYFSTKHRWTRIKIILGVLMVAVLWGYSKSSHDFRHNIYRFVDILPLPSGIRHILDMSNQVGAVLQAPPRGCDPARRYSGSMGCDRKDRRVQRHASDITHTPHATILGRAAATATRQVNRVTPLHKKMVASQQKWKCMHCNALLDYSYEIDHIQPLYQGGTNDLSNLQALCRNCHGRKTLSSTAGTPFKSI